MLHHHSCDWLLNVVKDGWQPWSLLPFELYDIRKQHVLFTEEVVFQLGADSCERLVDLVNLGMRSSMLLLDLGSQFLSQRELVAREGMVFLRNVMNQFAQRSSIPLRFKLGCFL